MFKHNSHKKSVLRKLSIAALSGVMAVSLGLAAACTTSDDTESDSSTTKIDNQTILNGNFEFFSDSSDGTYIIYTPNSWSSSTSGKTNYVMSGIIDTSASGWEKISADDLADTLDYNNSLDSSDDDYDDLYVDYNGMKSIDIPYANPAAALSDDATDEDKALIDNPLTHNVITDNGDGTAYYTDSDGETVTLYSDDDGNYYTDEELATPYESHVLMIHNYVNSDYRYGTAQAYTSSTTITLEPNMAAEISMWVKTSDLIFNRDGETVEEELGAYIAINQTVGGNTIDSTYMEGINTSSVTDNNGWVQFTFFIQGCDFATSTVTVELGLGRADNDSDYSKVLEGYAFFDDVECTLYSSLDNCDDYTNNKYINQYTTCSLTDEGDDKVFSYDNFKDETDFANGYGRNFLIDLTSQEDRTEITLNNTVSAGLTQDDDGYVTSSTSPECSDLTYTDNTSSYRNPDLDISTSKDVLATFSLNSLSSLFSNSDNARAYQTLIENAFANASSLPGADEDTTALLLLSAYGAAYTSTITSGEFTVGAGSYMIVSFWVKTSDMDGFTGATINIVDADDDEVSSSLTVDTTDVTFDVGDEKDIYDGWVQCFFYVENSLEADKTFKIEFCFGNTTIKDTTISGYKSGYAALTNLQVFSVDEDVYTLASTGDYAATFSFTETDNRENNYMDTAYGALGSNIETNITRPSSYNGVNGGSASVVYTDVVDYEGYDARNANGYAGLINQDYFEDYVTAAKEDSSYYAWLELLLNFNGYETLSAITDASKLWEEIFGTTTIQPLLIVNTVRTFVENDNTTYAINYGFVSSSSTSVSSSSYQAITVRVYVSAGAVAYVYLTSTDDRTEISEFSLPDYSFWYDSAGNVLDSEPDYDDESYNLRDHIVYYLRDDGLYEDKDGNLFANLYNYSRVYYDESALYYEKGATEPTSFENLDNDTIYYINAEEAAKEDGIQSPHYLVAYDTSGNETRVFSYSDGVYRYIITTTDSDGNSVVSYSDPVSNFVIGTENGGVELRYDNTENSKQLYAVIDASYDADGNKLTSVSSSTKGYDAYGNETGNQWYTVTFYVHTGDESVSYYLELWSGARETSGVTEDGKTITDDGSVEGSYVIFDYSNVTVDEDTYAELTEEYSNKIIQDYIGLLKSYITSELIASADKNISYYEKLFDSFVESGDLNEGDRPSYYDALYYTYSLYDDENYVPFNSETASDDETGYDYSADDYSETLVYLKYTDYTYNTVSIFVDYSATDVSISTSTSDDTSDEEDTTESDLNVWLLIASIILSVVLIFTLISLLIRELLKKTRRRRKLGKNVYSGKRKHYIRKLGLTEAVKDEQDNAQTESDNAQPEEQTESDNAQPEEQTESDKEKQSDDGDKE